MNRVLAGGALAIFIAAMAAIALTSMGSGGGGTTATTTVTQTRARTRPQPPAKPPKPARIALAPVGPYDPPPGDGTENDSEVANVLDGNPATFWSTEHYSSPLGTYKQGVGIVVDAGRRRAIGRVLVGTDEAGSRAEIQLADVPTGPYRIVSADKSLTGTTAFPLKHGAKGRYLLVWITALAPTTGEAHITEVRALTG